MELLEQIETYLEGLKSVYNRGLSHGNYYLGQELDAYSTTKGSQATKEKTALGIVINYFAQAGVAQIELQAGEVAIGDEIKIIGATTGVYSGTVDEIRTAEQLPVSQAKKGDTITIPVSERVRPNDQVYLWKDK